MNKTITYKIEITCEVNKDGFVVPVGSSDSIMNEKNENINMAKYPDTHKIMIIWLGKYFSYPKSNE